MMTKNNCRDRGFNFDTGIECLRAECGGSLCISDNADGLIYDGNNYECEDCGAHGSMHVYPNGDGKPEVVACEIENPYSDGTKEYKAFELVRVERKASVSLTQRRLRLGYMKAAEVIATLEDDGYIGSPDGAAPRAVYI